jgi:hypothetical protein
VLVLTGIRKKREHQPPPRWDFRISARKNNEKTTNIILEKILIVINSIDK